MLQAEIEEKEVTTTAGGGAVTVTVSGKKEITRLEIKPEVVDPDDVETLQDMTVQALNDALGQIDEATKKSMGAFAGKLPF